MTDRSNDAPDEDLEPTQPMPTGDEPAESAATPADDAAPVDEATPVGDEIAEEAPDLTDAQLDAATEGAVAEVDAEDAGLGVDEADVEEALEADAEADEAADDAADDVAAESEAEEAAEPPAEAEPALPRGARARAEALRARERAAREAREARAAQSQRRGFRRPREEAAQPSSKAAFPIDPSLRIKDPVSTAFVAASVLVFLGIFLYAMAFGKKGAFTPERTPRPTPSIVAPSGSPGASGSPSPSGSAVPSGATGSAAPSAGTSGPAASTAPSASPAPLQ